MRASGCEGGVVGDAGGVGSDPPAAGAEATPSVGTEEVGAVGASPPQAAEARRMATSMVLAARVTKVCGMVSCVSVGGD